MWGIEKDSPAKDSSYCTDLQGFVRKDSYISPGIRSIQ